jgi:hypothetical protein
LTFLGAGLLYTGKLSHLPVYNISIDANPISSLLNVIFSLYFLFFSFIFEFRQQQKMFLKLNFTYGGVIQYQLDLSWEWNWLYIRANFKTAGFFCNTLYVHIKLIL